MSTSSIFCSGQYLLDCSLLRVLLQLWDVIRAESQFVQSQNILFPPTDGHQTHHFTKGGREK